MLREAGSAYNGRLMWRTTEGSTGRLIQLCAAYFLFYVVTGVTVKYFQGAPPLPALSGMTFLVYSTLGGSLVCLIVAVSLGWWRLKSTRRVRFLGTSVPSELAYIIPSGICTAVVIPTTTLMYSLPISVMVAMVIMRGSVIVISRAVDAIQIRQGILRKTVYREEDLAVLFALLAVGVHLVWGDVARLLGIGDGTTVKFDFVRSPAAVIILGSYILAYAFRIYIMNFFKNTRGKGVPQDNKGFFALEQIAATVTMVAVTAALVASPSTAPQLVELRAAITAPPPSALGAITLGGFPYGAVAFFSVFIFMFKGRTATFAGLVNRLTSLVAGTTATLVSYVVFGGSFPKSADWISLGFILVAVGFLTRAEKRRSLENRAAA